MSNERRKYYRTSLFLPIEVYSYACERSRFYEQTETLNVSPLGASFRLHNKVDIDDIVRLVIPMPLQLRLYDQDLSEYQIYAQVRRVRSRTDGYINVGVAFISKDAPDIEINQPILASKLVSEPTLTDSDDVFMTRPIGPQGLIKNSFNLPNPLLFNSSNPLSNQKSIILPSSNLLNNQLNQLNQSNQSNQSIKPISSPLVNNPSSNPLILPPARPEPVSLKHPTIAQNNSSSERNEPRAKLRLSLSIRGLDKNGQYFVEVIQTEDVSKHGICFMLCKHELEVNSIVEIVGFQGKFQAQGEVKHINFNLVDKTYRIGIRLLGQPNNWIVK
ncbi:MAG: hypothetical protein FD167_4496 [bacterium]|nr:MAG: hypothetical protein FD167_4496 [bacterium]